MDDHDLDRDKAMNSFCGFQWRKACRDKGSADFGQASVDVKDEDEWWQP